MHLCQYETDNVDYRIWLFLSSDRVPDEIYYRAGLGRLSERYRVKIKCSLSNDSYVIGFNLYGRTSEVSAQLYGSRKLPYGNFKLSSEMCLRVRLHRYQFHGNDHIPRLLYLYSITMMPVPDIKYSSSTMVILLFGIIGLLSDITALNISEAMVGGWLP